MNNYTIHHQNHSVNRNYLERAIVHRNSRNILSILFDEVNCSDEKFEQLKKEIHAKHMYHHTVHRDLCNDVFSSFT